MQKLKNFNWKNFFLQGVLPFALAITAAFIARYQLELSDGVTPDFLAMQWPLYATLNALTAFCLTLILFALCGRWSLSTGLSGAVFTIIALINYYTRDLHGSALMPQDILNLGTAAEVMGSYTLKITQDVVKIALLYLPILGIAFVQHLLAKGAPKRAGWPARIVRVAGSALGVFLVMFFVLGVRLYWFAVGGAAVAAAIPLLWTYFLKDYQKKRLVAPYDPTVDPDGWGITWQTTQSKLTLASGRFTGVEEGHRASVFTGKHTDFIFSCIGENYGMLGCLLVVLLLMIIIVHCAYIGLHAGRTFDMLVCMGVTAAVAFQTFINIGMCLGITPVIGITLPFFSYGGSSMVTMFGAMGLVSGTKFKPKPQHGSLLY